MRIVLLLILSSLLVSCAGDLKQFKTSFEKLIVFQKPHTSKSEKRIPEGNKPYLASINNNINNKAIVKTPIIASEPKTNLIERRDNKVALPTKMQNNESSFKSKFNNLFSRSKPETKQLIQSNTQKSQVDRFEQTNFLEQSIENTDFDTTIKSENIIDENNSIPIRCIPRTVVAPAVVDLDTMPNKTNTINKHSKASRADFPSVHHIPENPKGLRDHQQMQTKISEDIKVIKKEVQKKFPDNSKRLSNRNMNKDKIIETNTPLHKSQSSAYQRTRSASGKTKTINQTPIPTSPAPVAPVPSVSPPRPLLPSSNAPVELPMPPKTPNAGSNIPVNQTPIPTAAPVPSAPPSPLSPASNAPAPVELSMPSKAPNVGPNVPVNQIPAPTTPVPSAPPSPLSPASNVPAPLELPMPTKALNVGPNVPVNQIPAPTTPAPSAPPSPLSPASNAPNGMSPSPANQPIPNAPPQSPAIIGAPNNLPVFTPPPPAPPGSTVDHDPFLPSSRYKSSSREN